MRFYFMCSTTVVGFASLLRNTNPSFHETERKHTVAAAGKSDDPALFTCTVSSQATTVKRALLRSYSGSGDVCGTKSSTPLFIVVFR